MSLLGKLFGNQIPSWARPINRSDFQKFQSDVTASFAAHDIVVEFEWELGGAKCADGRQFGFHNLVRTWCDAAPAERRDTVDSFLRVVGKDLNELETDIDGCLDLLRLRLYDDEGIPEPSYLTKLPVADHLFAALVLDQDQSLTSVTPSAVENSKHSSEELLEIARENTWKFADHAVSRHETADGVITFVDAHYFGAALITSLHRLTETGETYLVAAPTRDILVFSKANDYTVDILMRFLTLASKISTDHPRQYILPYVMEYKDGKLRDLCDREADALILKESIWS